MLQGKALLYGISSFLLCRFFGPTGRGTEEHFGMNGKVDIINSTLGKALGGAAGGYTAGPQALIDLLRQRSRPYLFSNTLPPFVDRTQSVDIAYLFSLSLSHWQGHRCQRDESHRVGRQGHQPTWSCARERAILPRTDAESRLHGSERGRSSAEHASVRLV